MGGGRRREGKRQETKDQGTDGVAAAAAGDNQLNCFIGRATAQRTRICGDATTAKEKIIRMLPPLIITREESDEIVKIIKKIVGEVEYE